MVEAPSEALANEAAAAESIAQNVEAPADEVADAIAELEAGAKGIHKAAPAKKAAKVAPAKKAPFLALAAALLRVTATLECALTACGG